MSTIRAVFVLVVELQLSARTAHTSHVGPVTRYTLTNNIGAHRENIQLRAGVKEITEE